MSRELLHDGVATITIDNLGSGAVSVEPGPDRTVRGELDAADAAFLDDCGIRQTGDALQITLPRRWMHPPEVYLRLQVPAGLSYRIATGSADIRIAADAARSNLTTGSGDIELGRVADVTATSGSGSISIGELTGRSAQLTSASGDIAVGRAASPVRAKSASGDLRVDDLSGDLRANSASGDISISSTTASVDLRTASGDVEIGVADDLPAWLDLTSVSGAVDIGLDADHAPGENEPYVVLRARTASGDIAVHRA